MGLHKAVIWRMLVTTFIAKLNDAINTLKGNKPMDDFETKVDLTVDAFVHLHILKMKLLKWIFTSELQE